MMVFSGDLRLDGWMFVGSCLGLGSGDLGGYIYIYIRIYINN